MGGKREGAGSVGGSDEAPKMGHRLCARAQERNGVTEIFLLKNNRLVS